MTKETFKPVFRILHDLPEDKDAFGPHQKIADTLADMIAGPAETPEPDTDHAGYFVALEGGWGSGKSTVVKMLRESLKHKDGIDAQVVIFDAWAHSGDHLRRAFLEVLVDGLKDKASDKAKKSWKKLLEELSGRHKKTTEIRNPKFSFWGIAFGISVFLVPFGGVLASISMSSLDKPDFFSFISNACLGYTGFLLCILPLIILGFTQLRAYFTKDDEGERTNAWGLMLNQWETSTDILTSLDPEPTSVEFQKKFRDVVLQWLTDDNKRLVLAIDNLDRLPPSDAMHLWRTLQTFIDKNEHDPNTWAGKLWTLVPYDRGILQKHFREIRIANDSELPFVVEDKGGSELGHFEKIFDTSLHVPTPAPTLWQTFFRDLLTQAFPNEGPEAFDKTISLMEAVNCLNYTPRNLKRIINTAGPIYLQWRTEFSLAEIIYYVVEKRTPSIPQGTDPSIAAVLGRHYLFAMYAIDNNAPVEIARQGQLISAIAEQIPQGNQKTLPNLERHSGAFFGALLTWACQKNLPYWNTEQIIFCARNLITTGIFKRLKHGQKAKVRDIFIAKLKLGDIHDMNAPALTLSPLFFTSKHYEGLKHLDAICDHPASSRLILIAIVTTGAFPQIKDIILEIHRTRPSIFDDELIEQVIERFAHHQQGQTKEIEEFRAQLTSHRT